MPEICPVCGLPKKICTCEDIVREGENIRVFTERRSYGKIVTIIEGLNSREEDLEGLASKLKKGFGCGGTVKNGHIELQGDHRESVKKALADKGFPAQNVEVQ